MRENKFIWFGQFDSFVAGKWDRTFCEGKKMFKNEAGLPALLELTGRSLGMLLWNWGLISPFVSPYARLTALTI